MRKRTLLAALSLVALACEPVPTARSGEDLNAWRVGFDQGRYEPQLDLGKVERSDCAPAVSADTLGADELRIVTDRIGIPHVFGPSDQSVYFGSGYAQCMQRLPAMQRMRRAAQGRSAELEGIKALETDVLIRAMGLAYWAQREWDALEADTDSISAQMLRAWTAGVNACINLGAAPRGDDPDLLKRWAEVDALAVGKLVTFGNGNLLMQEELAGIADLHKRQLLKAPIHCAYAQVPVTGPSDSAPKCRAPMALQGGEQASVEGTSADWQLTQNLFAALRGLPSGATNAFAISASRSGGTSMLGLDPHQPLQSPGAFWIHHMHSSAEAGVRVIGASFTGTPTVQMGHNERVAFIGTTSFADTLDQFRVSEDGYDSWSETFDVQGRGSVQVAMAGRKDRRGAFRPLVTVDKNLLERGGERLVRGKPLVQWTGMDVYRDLATFHRMGRAQSLGELQRAVQRLVTSSNHWLLADSKDIAYQASGRVPPRPSFETTLPWRPIPNALVARAQWPRSEDGWTFSGPLPAVLPGVRDWLIAANQDPLGWTANGTIKDDPGYYGHSFAPGLRAKRLAELVGSLPSPTGLGDLKAVLFDDVSILARDLVPVLLEVLEKDLGAVENGAALRAELWALRDGRFRMVTGSSAPLVFSVILHELSRELRPMFTFRFGTEVSLYDAIAEAEPVYLQMLAAMAAQAGPNARMSVEQARLLFNGKAPDEAVLEALKRVGTQYPELQSKTYGSVHTVDYGGGYFPIGGGEDTIAYVSHRPNQTKEDGKTYASLKERFRVVKASEWRMVMDFDPETGTPRAEVQLTQPMAMAREGAAPVRPSGDYEPLYFSPADVLAARPSGRKDVCFSLPVQSSLPAQGQASAPED